MGSKKEPATGKVARLIPLPDRVPDMPREQYVLDCAYHGLSMTQRGTKLCRRHDVRLRGDREAEGDGVHDPGRQGRHRGAQVPQAILVDRGPGNTCWMSMSGNNAVAVIDLRTAEEIPWIKVGDHPQWVRTGTLASTAENR